MNRTTEIVCHRGANQFAPENTYASAQLCIDWGMDFLELDINTSRDGVMYVFHGPEMARTTNLETGKLYELDSSQIDELDCGAWFGAAFTGTKIPRLEEFLAWVDHRIKLFFDVKWAKLDDLAELIYRQKLDRECFFWFGRDKLAREFVALNSGLAIKVNAVTRAEVEIAKSQYGASIVEFGLADVTSDLLASCDQFNVKTMVLQRELDLDAYKDIIALGVDYANVDHGDQFLAVLNRDS